MIYLTNKDDFKLTEITGVYFYASWLILHKKMKILIDKMEKEYNFPFIAIDTDAFKEIAKKHKVSSIPTTLVLTPTGKELERIEGAPMTSAFRKIFNDLTKEINNE